MAMKLLAVGDIHLGRRPSKLPDALSDEAASLGPAAAFELLVEQAEHNGVDAVVFAGDVVEREDDFYEAYRELSRGVERLTAAGIEVLAVAGNHDVKVLPLLADQIPDFRLLGRNGEWETTTLQADGEQLTLHGWSFRDSKVRHSPLDGVRFTRGSGPNLGLLHCDRDQPGSPYAPVATRELAAADLDGWLLGHIHAPDTLSIGQPAGYLGCISGMDPGEPGDHGPWLLTINSGRIEQVEQWVLAPLRWESLPLDLTGLAAPVDVRGALLEAVRRRDEEIASKTVPPKAVGLRVWLTGRTGFGREAEQLLRQDEQSPIHDGKAGTRYFIERCIADTRPAIALEELATRTDPPGLLAKRLCLLDTPDQPAARRLIDDARARLEQQRRDARWQALDLIPLEDDVVIDWLHRSGTRLLETMLDQQGEAGP